LDGRGREGRGIGLSGEVHPGKQRSGSGLTILIAGPDGVGKSSLADALEKRLRQGQEVRRYHHRYRMLPGRPGAGRPTTTPHAKPAYSRWLSNAKLLFLFADYVLASRLLVRPFVRHGGAVIMERGWWDLVVDPARYRLARGSKLANRLGRLLPPADVSLILDASPAVVAGRKDELELSELARQREAWRGLSDLLPGAVLLDADGDLEMVTAAAEDALPATGPKLVAPEGRPGRWTNVPPGRPTRWIMPSRPRRAAAAGLELRQPMSYRALVLWTAARVAAQAGLFNLLPAAAEPELPAALRELVPPGGTASIALGSKPGRAIVMVIDVRGEAVCYAKVAADQAGREKIAREAEALELVGAFLEPPISAPSIIRAGDGFLVLEPWHWRPRLRPWELPDDLAAAMGCFYARGRASNGSEGGPSHGDFAPWNVLLVEDGWILLDWEDAEKEAPPFTDPFHYLVQAHALLGRPDEAALVAGLDGEGKVGAALRAYADAAGLKLADSRAGLIDYLVRTQQTSDPSRADGLRGLRARRRLLDVLGVPA